MLEGLKKEAGERRKGLWADLQLVPPWVFRMARRWVPTTRGRS